MTCSNRALTLSGVLIFINKDADLHSLQDMQLSNTDNLKKELATSVRKATQLIEQGELNAVEPVKNHKVKQPSEEEEHCALNAKLKDQDLDKMDPKGDV